MATYTIENVIEEITNAVREIDPKAVVELGDEGNNHLLVNDGDWQILKNEDGKYVISRAVTRHGVRYYPDGSGEPDDVDIVDVAIRPTILLAVLVLLEGIAKEQAKRAFEGFAEAWDMKTGQ